MVRGRLLWDIPQLYLLILFGLIFMLQVPRTMGLGSEVKSGGFSCYKCRSGSACDKAASEMETECKNPTVKTCIKAHIDAKVVRDCGVPDVEADHCLSESGTTVCICNSHLCNRSQRTGLPSALIIMRAPLMALLFVYFLNTMGPL